MIKKKWRLPLLALGLYLLYSSLQARRSSSASQNTGQDMSSQGVDGHTGDGALGVGVGSHAAMQGSFFDPNAGWDDRYLY